MPKAARATEMLVPFRGTNSFTSARVAVFNPPRGLESSNRLFVSNFSVF
jgi:hypothetical protein